MRKLSHWPFIVALSTALLLVACGGAGVSVTGVSVTLEENCRTIRAEPPSSSHGRVTFQVTNQGADEMTFTIYAGRDYRGEKKRAERRGEPYSLEDLGPGQTKSLSTELGDPGFYDLACEVNGEVVGSIPFTVGSLVDLVQGQVAPSWSGPLLGGGTSDLKDLRGQPALVLFVADWCDRACDVLPQFQQASEQWSNQVGFVAVDFSSTSDKVGKNVQEGGYTFPLVVDSSGNVGKAWGVEAVPLWVLLDAEGRVVEVRLRPQTLAVLNDLLVKVTR